MGSGSSSMCGGSSAVDIREKIPDSSCKVKDTSKRRKTKKKPHGSLLNAIAESNKAAEAFWTFASQRWHEWEDWQEWLHQPEENKDMESLRASCSQMCALFEKLNSVDEARMNAMRETIERMDGLLKELLSHDSVVKEYQDAVHALEDAQKKQASQKEKHERAKNKEGYQEKKQQLIQTDEQLERLVQEKKEIVEKRETAMASSGAALSTEKERKVQAIFVSQRQELLDYYRSSLKVLEDSDVSFPEVASKEIDAIDTPAKSLDDEAQPSTSEKNALSSEAMAPEPQGSNKNVNTEAAKPTLKQEERQEEADQNSEANAIQVVATSPQAQGVDQGAEGAISGNDPNASVV